MLLDVHDELQHVIIELFTATWPRIKGAPVPKYGQLLHEFDYRYDFEVFKEEYDSIFRTDDFNVPDGIIRNASLNISITCECKTGVSDKDRFLKQLDFFSEDQSFKKVFQLTNQKNEILVVCLAEIALETVNLIKKLNLNTKIVVWSVDMEPNVSAFPSQKKSTQDDTYFIRQIYGKHLDKRLNKKLETGISVPPPSNQFLTNQNTPMPQLVGEMAGRLLSNSGSPEDLDVDDFIANQKDAIIEDKKILKAIIYAFTLISKLGSITDDNKTIHLRKRLNHRQIIEILSRIEEIKKWDANRLNAEVKGLKKQTKQATMLDFQGGL
jgi:hypothetical protein